MDQTTTPITSTVVYAGFWKRVAASLLDAILLGAGVSIIAGITGLNHSDMQDIYTYGDHAMRGYSGHNPVSSLLIVVSWLYAALMESSAHQATVGKMALGIKVTDEEGRRISFGRATGRHFAKIISAIILAIGFLMVAFTEKKQGLHDKMADTLVVKK